MLSTTKCEAAISPALPARLRLQEDHSGPTVLDGGWWPRSADPATELPGLILALDKRHGRITRVMLGAADWEDSRPRQLAFGGPARGRVVHLGWFATMPAGLLTAISLSGQRTNLLTVPPHTSEKDGQAAMEQAAQPGNRDRTPAILAAVTAAARTPAQMGMGEWRSYVPDHSRPPATGNKPRLPSVTADGELPAAGEEVFQG